MRCVLKGAIVAGALMLLPVGLLAQAPQKKWPKPTVAIQKMLDDALKIKENPQRVDALKKVLGAATSASDVEGKGETESALAAESKGADAIPWLVSAASDFKAVLNLNQQARAFTNLGICYYRLEELPKALDSFKKSLAAQNDVGDKPMMGNTLANIGLVYLIQGELNDALGYFRQALPIQKQAGDKFSILNTLHNLGSIYSDLGEPQKALDYLSQALPIEKEVGDGAKPMMGNTLSTIGKTYGGIGQLQKALDYYNQALDLRKAMGDTEAVGQTLGDRGTIYDHLGQTQNALDDYNQALAIQKDEGEIGSEVRDLINIGDVYAGIGQSKRALDYFNQALPIMKKYGGRQSLGEILGNIGQVYGDLGQPQKALGYENQALAILKENGDRRGVAITLDQLGVAYRDLGQMRKALDYFTQSLSLLREVGDRSAEAETMDNSSRCLATEKLSALAIVFAKRSVNTYQDIRKDIQKLPKSDQDSYAKKVEPTYRHLADLLIKQGRLREAEKVMNLLKDEENFEFVARDAAGGVGVERRIEAIGLEGKWWSKYQVLQDKALKIDSDEFDLTQKSSQLRSSPSLTPQQTAELAKMDANLKQLDAQKEVIDEAADAYFDEVGRQASQLGDSIRKEAEERVRQTGDELPLLLGRIHRDTGEKIGAVYALASTDELDFLVVTYAGRAHLSVPVKSDDLNAMISEFRKGLMNPYADPKPAGEKLYQLVFEKLIRQLQEAGCTRVVWCLDGTLRYVPIGALWDGKEYLIERGDYTMFDPLNLERISADASKSLMAAGFAATEGKGKEFAPLPGADRELKCVVKDGSQAGFTGAVPGRAYENKGFDESNLVAGMRGEQFSLLHIATHFNIGKDFNSSDLLLGDGNLLSLKQFTDAGSHGRLGHLDLVCLSACDTAESFGDSAGTGSQFSSFVSLTLKDGASSVVASLWPVSDASTPILMQQFYANWMANKHQGKAAALRHAQLSLLHGESEGSTGNTRSTGANSSPGQKAFVPDPVRPFAHPYFWAPFILFGNWK
jgi:CHAT domain-containing protein/tetratricopeptide (TPR) repeat protein